MNFENLYSIIAERKKAMPKNSYTVSLFRQGLDRIIQKLGEEAVEVVIAAKDKRKNKTIQEVADLFFIVTVLLVSKNITLQEIYEELGKRRTGKKNFTDTS
ncbi:phosphoribosyl-ATP diphosphatase [Candidatus Gottesmanbacteria bacterium]|nr:phosphoribosyl-ATP diphosphatase [Candidatus Gottesmanbacteria bacterium]